MAHRHQVNRLYRQCRRCTHTVLAALQTANYSIRQRWRAECVPLHRIVPPQLTLASSLRPRRSRSKPCRLSNRSKICARACKKCPIRIARWQREMMSYDSLAPARLGTSGHKAMSRKRSRIRTLDLPSTLTRQVKSVQLDKIVRARPRLTNLPSEA